MNLTPLGFGIVVAILLIVAVIVAAAENLRDREDAQDEVPVVRIKCDLESCGEPSVVEFAGGNGPLYICAKHAGPVSAWAPVVGVRMPYDQENGVAS